MSNSCNISNQMCCNVLPDIRQMLLFIHYADFFCFRLQIQHS